jgi:hypothetical protein
MHRLIKIRNDEMDVHDADACDNKTAHPAIVPWSTTATATATTRQDDGTWDHCQQQQTKGPLSIIIIKAEFIRP